MKYGTVIFDMDGTILDTLEDMQAAVNAALAEEGFPVRTLDEVRRFVGNGNRLLAARAVPEGAGPDAAERVLRGFHRHYRGHCADHTKAYRGVIPLIENLRAAGVKTAVVSNKADYAVQALAENYFPGLFDFVTGEREGIRRKPAPDGVLAAMEALGADRARTVYVGDSEVDLETAANAEIPCIAVCWGFRTKSELLARGAERMADTAEALEFLLR